MNIKSGFARSRQHGFSMIEALVAMLILAVGLLGMLVMQTRGGQLNQAGYYQSQARFMAEDMVERIRANLAAADSYDIKFGDTVDMAAAVCNDPESPCSLADLAAADLTQWKTALATFLPAGDGQVTVAPLNGNLYPINIQISYHQGEVITYQLEAML
jgi:type IV pilus assembly protein PilV